MSKKHKKTIALDLPALHKKHIKWSKQGLPKKMTQDVADYVRADLLSTIVRAANGTASGLNDLLKITLDYPATAQRILETKKIKSFDRAIIFQKYLIDTLYEATKSHNLTQILRGKLITQKSVIERRKLTQLLNTDPEFKKQFEETLEQSGEFTNALPRDATTKEILDYYNADFPVELLETFNKTFKTHKDIVSLDWMSPKHKAKIKATPETVGVITYMKAVVVMHRYARLREIAFIKDGALSPMLLFLSILHIQGEHQAWIYNEAIKMLVSNHPDKEVLFMELVTEEAPDSIEEYGFDPVYYAELPLIQLLHELGHHLLEEWDDEVLVELFVEQPEQLDLIAGLVRRFYNFAEETAEEMAENEEYVVEPGCVIFEAIEDFYVAEDPDPLELGLELSRVITLLAVHLTIMERGEKYKPGTEKFAMAAEEYALMLFDYSDE